MILWALGLLALLYAVEQVWEWRLLEAPYPYLVFEDRRVTFAAWQLGPPVGGWQ